MSSESHKAVAPSAVRVFVLTVSDTRTDDSDTSGSAICELLKATGHHVTGKAIEKDDPARVAELVRQQAAIADVDAIITTGGTGLTSRDSTFESIAGPGPLGYEDSQALVAFHYNTPNNTLPILWASGLVAGRDWVSIAPPSIASSCLL